MKVPNQNLSTGLRRWVKPITEYVPLCVFFVVYLISGLFAATAALIVATIIVFVLAFVIEKKLATIPLFIAAVVIVFGGLTLWLQDETFIKMKPTIVQLCLGGILLVGLYTNNIFLEKLLGSSLKLDQEGWHLFTRRFSFFFFAMAALNEIVWRTQSTDFWVSFKVFGILGFTILFLVTQVYSLKRHLVIED